MTLITLFTDASFCNTSKIAAYAIWAKTSGKTIRHSGLMKSKAPNSHMAETVALVNGIFVVCALMSPEPGSKIIAQSDCVAAINTLMGEHPLRRKASRAIFAPVIRSYREQVKRSGVIVEFRHVRGHQGAVTTRNAVNEWCDNECRRLLRAARAELRAERDKKAGLA
ncbi:MAG: hypothetical protein PHZ23_16240 [Acidiphilium sp.]|nr:hypothetical protein [Acidiphilium sp.]